MNDMSLTQFTGALFYSWITYIQRSDFTLKKMFSDDKTQGKNKIFEDVDWRGINPVEQALRKERSIPPKVKEMMKNSGMGNTL